MRLSRHSADNFRSIKFTSLKKPMLLHLFLMTIVDNRSKNGSDDCNDQRDPSGEADQSIIITPPFQYRIYHRDQKWCKKEQQ